MNFTSNSSAVRARGESTQTLTYRRPTLPSSARPPAPAGRLQPSPWALLVIGLAGALVLVILYATGREGGYRWGWYVVLPTTEAGRQNLQFLLGGLWVTIQISVLATLLATILGLLVALPGLADDPWARRFNRGFVEIFRAVPSLVMLLWVHYGLPILVGINFDVFTSGVIGLALCEAAFMAEVFRAGIQSVERGQTEAGRALGLGRMQRFRLIVLPQALRRILPALGNQFVIVLKMSALVSVIGLADLTRRANELVTTLYRPLEVYTFLVLEYLVLVLIVSWLVRRLETRLAVSDGR